MNRLQASYVFAPLVLVLGLSSTVSAQAPPLEECVLTPPPGVSEQQIRSGQRPRSYRLFIPGASSTAMPLVLDLHGSGGNAEGQARTSQLEVLAGREGFVVATLEADTGRRWNVPVTAERADDVAYVSDVIGSVGAITCIDSSRVYSTGFSGGARMTSLLGCQLNDQIAAIAPVAGLRWPAPCEGRALPVLTFHGLADGQNPYEGYADGRGAEWEESVPEAMAGWAEHNQCSSGLIFDDPAGPLSTMRFAGCEDGAEVRLIRIDGLGHTWPRDQVDATAVMWEFFTRHQLPE